MNDAVLLAVLFGVALALLFIRLSAIERRLNRLSRLDGKVDALLRRFRKATGVDLKEAKEFVDEIRRRGAA